MSLRRIERLTHTLNLSIQSFTGNLNYPRVIEGLTRLADAVHEYEGETETMWYIGDHYECLSDLLVGAYWHCVHNHGGQSWEVYATQYAIGQVFSPGCSSEEEENQTYSNLNNMARQYHPGNALPDITPTQTNLFDTEV